MIIIIICIIIIIILVPNIMIDKDVEQLWDVIEGAAWLTQY